MFQEPKAVMLFYQVGECFQSYAVNRSRKSIADLMDIRPDYANVIYNNIGCQKYGQGRAYVPGTKFPIRRKAGR